MTTTQDEIVWQCDYCNEIFATESQAIAHEVTCPVRHGKTWADVEGDDNDNV